MNFLRDIGKSRLFWLGVAVKLAFLWSPGSHYLNELFIPFLDKAVLNPGQNPWSLSPPESFPYGSVLFLSLYLPRLVMHAIFGAAALGVTPLGIALVKGVLLSFDALLFLFLCKFAKEDLRRIIVFYWLNPVLIYISYVHGQLDVASISLCIGAAYFLSSERIVLSALMMAAAILCKFHVAVLLPFWIVYLWLNDFMKVAARKIAVFCGTLIPAVIVGFLPLVLAGRLGNASVLSPEIRRMFALALPLDSVESLYFGVFIVVGMLGRLCISTRITPTGLLFGSGLVMGTLVLGTHAAPGWYYWFLPFAALVAARYRTFPRISLLAVVVFYMAYFASTYSFPDNSILRSCLFTVLQTSVLGALISIYLIAVRSEAPTAGFSKPIMVGIAGDSGVGKNHLSRLLAHIFGPRNSTIIEGDDYHKWERGHESWERYTHLNPKANHLLAMAKHAALFSQGRRAVQRSYDHATGMFTLPRVVSPSRTVIMQGLHTLYLCGLRRELDLKIFIKCTDDLRLVWKLRRDVAHRGLSAERVVETMKKRSGDAEKFISLQETVADWVIAYFPNSPLSADPSSAQDIDLAMKFTLPNDYDFEGLIACAEQSSNLRFAVGFLGNDLDRVSITVSGQATAAQIETIANLVFQDMRHLTRALYPPRWDGGMDGVIQLFALGFIEMRARTFVR